MYVRRLDLGASGSAEAFAHSCLDEGLARGFSLDLLRQAFAKLAQDSQMRRFLVVDSDARLAHILAAEISEALDYEFPFASDVDAPRMLTSNSCVLLTEASSAKVSFFDAVEHRTIRFNSMQDLLIGRERPSQPVLIAVVSSSPSVRRWAATLLSALGFSADSVLLRDPAETGWHDGLNACEIVAADILASPQLAPHMKRELLTFRLVSADSLSEIRSLLKSSASDPGTGSVGRNRGARELSAIPRRQPLPGLPDS
jgi:hypothetical protein